MKEIIKRLKEIEHTANQVYLQALDIYKSDKQ